MTHQCILCKKSYSKISNLNRHIKTSHDQKFSRFACGTCQKSFTTNHYARKHAEKCRQRKKICIQNQIGMGSENFHNHSDEVENTKASDTTNENDDLKKLIEQRWSSIKTYFKCQRIVDIFNFRLFDQKKDLKSIFTRIWLSKIHSQVKIQCSLGYVLQHKTTHQLRYYHSSSNNTQIFPSPTQVGNLGKLLQVCDLINDIDLFEIISSKRPDSSWSVLTITNITFHITKLDFSKFGTPTTLPKHICKNKSLIKLLSNNYTRYNDNLCFFRALALALNCTCTKRCVCLRKLEPVVTKLLTTFLDFEGINTCPENFPGVSFSDLVILEDLFKVKITVYKLEKTGKAMILHQSFKNYRTELNLCAVKNHFCYIRNMNAFTKCFKCQSCSTCFSLNSRLKKHMVGCAKKQSKFIYKGDNFFPPKNIFEEIEQETTIKIPIDMRYYPFRATFDIECYLPKSSEPSTSKLSFSNEHVLMSISVCSNIPNYTLPKTFVSDGCIDTVVENFVIYLEELSETAKYLCYEKFSNLFISLLDFRKTRLASESEFKRFAWSNSMVYENRSIESLIKKLDSYIEELPVIGFNSQKYDINCMRAPLIRYLAKHDKIKFAIKRDNTLKCIKTSKLKFLDIVNYIAPGFSYENFIKAYGCKLQKGFFPYEYIDSLSKLKECELPLHQSFYSNLKQKNISVEEYAQCQKVWKDRKMKNLRDFLIHYNELDVLPFLEAIEIQHKIYREKGIDMFKDSVSVPSLATKWLYLESNKNEFSIPLISKKNSDLNETIRKNLVGGPSIVFHRYHEKDKTYIRQADFGENSKSCKNVYGFDANALYLWSAMQKLPTGSIIRRKAENNFKPRFSDYYGRLSLEWLEFEAYHRGISIMHKYNNGEHKVGQHALPVDGIAPETNIVFQFHGCLFHGCQLASCSITKGIKINPINNIPLEKLHADTKLKELYIQSLGYNLIVLYECEWMNLKKTFKPVKDFVNQMFHRNMIENKPMKESEIIDAVKEDAFYGFVEVDIEVPEHLQKYFSEMPPIFKNVQICRSDLSDVMLEYALKHNLMSQPRSSLIGSFYGKKILLLTPLLKWYLCHGLIVKKVFQVVQFHGKHCFTQFGNTVCNMRREADRDSSKKILAETAKLCGNVIYGTTITNKAKFTDVKYVTDVNIASKLVNTKHFMSLQELDSDVFEIQLSKSKIRLDTPIVVGFAILQFAKLRMLEFYYDFMCTYFNQCDYQYITMDTDSAYFATSGNFEDIIKSDKRYDFYINYDKWFVPPFCKKHKYKFVYCKLSNQRWVLEKCCTQAQDFHRRTPGLFKQEYQGNGVIALNSKTYFCFGDDGNKTSMKGIMKSQNLFQKKEFLKALKQKKIIHGVNRGIVRRKNEMLTYSQVRAGLSYFYAKRKVLGDDVSTLPLNK